MILKLVKILDVVLTVILGTHFKGDPSWNHITQQSALKRLYL